MTNSQNGWHAYSDTSHYVRATSCEFGFWAANDDVAVIFADLINQFHNKVEHLVLKPLSCWSYADRLVRGSTSVVSNHGSATAIDLNAPKHPRGKKNTFTKAQVATIHSIVNQYDKVVRWGGDYVSALTDEMHFEINSNSDHTRHVADKIREKNEMKPEDFVQIRKIIREEIVDVLKTEKLVPNKPLDADSVPAANWTFVGLGAALDQKTDLQGRDIKAVLATVTKESE